MTAASSVLQPVSAQQVADSQGNYDPHWHYRNEPETRAALDLIFADHFSRGEPGIFNRESAVNI